MRIASILLAIGIIVTGPHEALAIPILDQSHDLSPPQPDFLAAPFGIAQTFRVGISGTITRVDVLVRLIPSDRDLIIELRPTPQGGAIASATVPSEDIAVTQFVDTWLSVDIGFLGPSVVAGDELAIAMIQGSGGNNAANWFGTASGNLYGAGTAFNSGGSPFFAGGADFAFKTFVETEPIPEPSTALLIATGLVGLALRRRRAQTQPPHANPIRIFTLHRPDLRYLPSTNPDRSEVAEKA